MPLAFYGEHVVARLRRSSDGSLGKRTVDLLLCGSGSIL